MKKIKVLFWLMCRKHICLCTVKFFNFLHGLFLRDFESIAKGTHD